MIREGAVNFLFHFTFHTFYFFHFSIYFLSLFLTTINLLMFVSMRNIAVSLKGVLVFKFGGRLDLCHTQIFLPF
jgi:hypothetical protein